ncbi:DMT family transporter [Castellaniella caeni]|uniref:DMT family transporter n=1 Tax=Castellaniella caeni TaxID=266123 RepID=UPI000836A101|nr:DMT family transporter [Castellaniella caeni]
MSAAPAGAAPGLAYACLAASMFVVGAYVALSKPLAAIFPVFLLGCLRFGIGSLSVLHWLRKPPAEAALTRRVRALVFLESFIGSFLFTVFMVLGVSYSSAVAAGIIMSAIPAAIAVLSRLVLKEAIRPRVLAAIACAVCGIALLALTQAPDPAADGGAPQRWLGYALLGGAVLCEAAYAVIGKQLTGALSARRISALMNVWGFVLMLPAGAYAAWHFDFSAITAPTWGLLLFYGLAASWTIWLWMTGLRRVPASRAGVFTVMLPVGAACVGVGVLGEPFSGLHALAFAAALLGLVLAAWPDARRRQAGRACSISN